MVAYPDGDPASRLQSLAARAALLRDLSRRAHALGPHAKSLEQVTQQETVQVEAMLAKVVAEVKEKLDPGKKVTQVEADLQKARAELRKVTAELVAFRSQSPFLAQLPEPLGKSLRDKVQERTSSQSSRPDPSMLSSRR